MNTQKTPAKPENDFFQLTLGEETREIFMSYGLLSSLVSEIQVIDNITIIPFNTELRTNVLKLLLAERTSTGKLVTPLDQVDPDDFPLTVETVEKLLAWVGEHVMGFFMRSLQQAGTLLKAHEAQMPTPTPPSSENG